MKTRLREKIGCVLLGAATFGAASAANLPKEGNYNYTACWTSVTNPIDFNKSHQASSFEMNGTTRSNPPDGLFDRNTYRCVGANASFEGKASLFVVCEAVDPDGDRRLSIYSSQGGQVIREHIAGTGKYDGMVLSSTVQMLPPFPVIKPGTSHGCNVQSGTYRLK